MTEESKNIPSPNPLMKEAYKSPDFYVDYANNVFLEGSVWDMKLIFGQLDQRTIPARVEQHGSVTLPWSQAKVFAYLLCVHLAGNEMQNGTINVPQSVLPPLPTPPTEEAKKAQPNLQTFFERIMWIREQFFGPTPRS